MTSIEQYRALFDVYQRQPALHPLAIREEVLNVVRFTHHEIQMGFVLYSNLTAASADPGIEAQILYYRQLGYAFEWKYYSYDDPPDLPERLLHNGFIAEDREALMLLDMQHAPQILLDPPQQDIRRIPTLEGLRDADAVHSAVWGTENAVSERVSASWAVAPDLTSVYVGYVDGEPACYGRIEFSPPDNPFASIWGGATIPRYRKQGLYTALVAARLQEALSRGYRYLTIDADPNTSMPILQKLGFVTIAYTTPFVWSPPEGSP